MELHSTFVTPSLTEDLPRIHLPGDTKFSSYKNSLQEYCQRRHMSVPVYGTQTTDLGYILGHVTFSLNQVRAEKPQANVKEAEARAAYDSLIKLGYDLKDHPFTLPNNSLKRQHIVTISNGSVEVESNIAKVLKKDGTTKGIPSTAKSLLNEYAQKKGLPCPVYSCVPCVDWGFTSTCTFNGQEFDSANACKKRKEAEHSAAHVALEYLNAVPSGEDSEEEEEEKSPLPPKQRLLEYCDCYGLKDPEYTSIIVDEERQIFSCTVVVGNNEYIGQAHNDKEKAEISAAEKALKKLDPTTIEDVVDPYSITEDVS